MHQRPALPSQFECKTPRGWPTGRQPEVGKLPDRPDPGLQMAPALARAGIASAAGRYQMITAGTRAPGPQGLQAATVAA